jgi:hypothetical protein
MKNESEVRCPEHGDVAVSPLPLSVDMLEVVSGGLINPIDGPIGQPKFPFPPPTPLF